MRKHNAASSLEFGYPFYAWMTYWSVMDYITSNISNIMYAINIKWN